MRLFATGAMNWVMGKAFPDDVPLEAKMVTKAIERAQRTVEDRNFEIRKDVLKYDEVMNEQRKVIYQRRQQILDGDDLRERGVRGDRRRRRATLVETYCPGEYPEEWDLDELHRRSRCTYPDEAHARAARRAGTSRQLSRAASSTTRSSCYEQKEQTIGADTLREIERRVMLSVIDQHWREHLYEMDYLREGINLRAMGQRDPLAEWQREGFDMFEAMMAGIEDDFVRYVSHLQVVADDAPRPAARNLRYIVGRGPGAGLGARCGPRRPAQPLEEPVADGMRRRARRRRRPPAVAERRGRGATARARREDARSQRALLLRQRQEVQALPRPLNRGRLRRRTLRDARLHRRPGRPPPPGRRRARLPAGRRRAGRLAELEQEASRPDLWDDPDPARQGHDRARPRPRRRRARRRPRGAALRRSRRCTSSAREEGDDSVEPEIDAGIAALRGELDRLELRALFTGEHDERDAICEVHSGAGGTDAQDWTEMLLRMYTRWAERRGFDVELDEVQEGTEAGITSATFT